MFTNHITNRMWTADRDVKNPASSHAKLHQLGQVTPFQPIIACLATKNPVSDPETDQLVPKSGRG